MRSTVISVCVIVELISLFGMFCVQYSSGRRLAHEHSPKKAHNSLRGTTCEADEKLPWSYSGHNNGPSAWGKTYPNCYGTSQSPIAIYTRDVVVDTKAKQLKMKNYEIPIRRLTIVNTGYSIEVTPRDGVTRTFEVKGSTFTLQQLHFHWGSHYHQGSEHTLDGQRYALEAHFVHTNKDRATAVVAVFFQPSIHRNAGFRPISDVLSRIPFRNDSVNLQSSLILEKLLPQNPSGFYHYYGSLTTPGCDENVAWFILKGIKEIGKTQLSKFQDLYSTTKEEDHSGCKISNNFRPLQPLNGRKVFETE